MINWKAVRIRKITIKYEKKITKLRNTDVIGVIIK